MEQVRKTQIPDTPSEVADFGAERQSRSHLSERRTGKRALIVEATSSSLRLCRDTLERLGFAVETANSGIAALTSAREHRPDLIVMDLQLPDVPGRELIGWLRDIPALRSTPILILAGASGDGIEAAYLGPNVLLRRSALAPVIHRAVREALGLNC